MKQVIGNTSAGINAVEEKMKIGDAVFQCQMGLKEGLTEKVTFEQGPQGGEGRKNIPDKGDSKGKTQRPEHPWCAQGTAV